jgi:hypothetical protein
MTKPLQEIEAELLKLEAPERAALAKALIDSLDNLTPEEFDELWAAEAEDRYAAFLRGEMPAEDGDEVLARARRREL